MADTHSSLFLVGRPTDTPKRETSDIAREALTISRQCLEAIQRYQAETEIRLGGIADLLMALIAATSKLSRSRKGQPNDKS